MKAEAKSHLAWFLLMNWKRLLNLMDIKSKPTPSWFRGLSAPVKFHSNLTVSDKLYLCANDTDPYNRWDNIQGLWLDYICRQKRLIKKTSLKC